jgi:protein phosphatase
MRETNQDCVFSAPDLGLVVLADGMGGHAGGEVASDVAITTIVAVLKDALLSRLDEVDSSELSSTLMRAFERANEKILDRASENADLKGMGTTVVLALEHRGTLHIAHVGDSRAYLLQQSALRCLTHDHSLVAEMVNAGELSPSQARNHRLRNYLTRSLGRQVPQVELQSVTWHTGDYLLLCSDGLTSMLEDRKIEKLMTRYCPDLNKTCEELVKAANSKGGKDNISVVLACPD